MSPHATLIVGPDVGPSGTGAVAKDKLKSTQFEKLLREAIAKAKAEQKAVTLQDGGGLAIKVKPTGSPQWQFRYTWHGKRCDMGLGVFPAVSLAAARAEAEQARRDVAAGIEPREARNARMAPAPERIADRPVTFRDEAEEFLRLVKLPSLTSDKNRAQWVSMLANYCYPVIGAMPINDIRVPDVLRILQPIWTTKHRTAQEVHEKLCNVFDYSMFHQRRTLASPMIGIRTALPKVRKQVAHRKALPWQEVPMLLKRLDTLPSARASRLCLELTILTAVRPGEARNAEWREFDLFNRVWVVPTMHAKQRREHRVPLSDAALAVLARAEKRKCELHREGGPLVFPGDKVVKPISNNTVNKLLERIGYDVHHHGFRSTIRDWGSENEIAPEHVLEAVLAHKPPSKTMAAYARSDLLKLRVDVMQRWGEYCRPGLAANDDDVAGDVSEAAGDE